ncbi:MAG: hypothetical protein IKL50_04485 [Bacteroidales bacterium]|nr:hypothetical protein [Bacteroidales bacterium]
MIHKIKISLCALLVSLTSFSGYAQDCDISIRVVAPEESQLTKSAEDLLVKRVSQASNVENIVVGEGSSFAIIPKLVCLTKDVIPGPPVRYSLDFELTLYLTDVNTGTIFYSETLPLKGVDNSESKAQISALRQLKPNAPQLMALFKKGKQKAIAYYDANGADIIAKAQRLAAMKQFEEAIYTVMAIPNCSKYGDQATEVAIKIFDRYMDEQCNENLQAAQAAWVAEQNASGARKAAQYLSQIYPEYGCYSEAQKLYNEMKKVVGEDKAFENSLILAEIDIENNKINAIRDIGVAYGKGQQPITTNIFGVGD